MTTTTLMKDCEGPLPSHGISASNALLKEIERALEMMRRVRTANPDQADKAVDEPPANRYVLPEPSILRTGQIN